MNGVHPASVSYLTLISCVFPRDATVFKRLPLCPDNELTKYETIFVVLNLEPKIQFYSRKKKKKINVEFRPLYAEQLCVLCRGTPQVHTSSSLQDR